MIDIDSLLNPIVETAPSGRDLRLVPGDETFAKVKDQRTTLDPALDPDGKGREPNWPGVVKTCQEALENRTKDLELAVWLCEGLAYVDGFAGLVQGLELMRRILDTFWDTVHPGCDEDGISLPIRGRPISWLGSSAEFQRAVKDCPLVPASEGATLSWAVYEGTTLLDDQTLAPERRSELTELGFIGGEQWDAAFTAAPSAELRKQAEVIGTCEEKLRQIDAKCHEKFDPEDEEPPNLYPLLNLFSQMREYIESKVGAGEEAGAVGGEAAAAAPAGASAASGQPGVLASRQDALLQLRQVAEYFRRVEPHSPISYLVARAVKWGDMSFEELIVDLTQNKDVLGHIRETLGLGVDG
jgi:type VI secretion system protein ImpA